MTILNCPAGPGGILRGVRPGCAALTFDDGPHPENHRWLLDFLKDRQIKACFFVTGRTARQYPFLLEEILSGGHDIGNHTQNHRRMDRLTEEELVREIEEAQAAIFKSISVVPRFFRQSFSAPQPLIPAICAARDLIPVLGEGWCSDLDRTRTADDLLRTLLEQKSDSPIYGLHCHSPFLHDLLPSLTDHLLTAGYSFVTLADILGVCRT